MRAQLYIALVERVFEQTKLIANEQQKVYGVCNNNVWVVHSCYSFSSCWQTVALNLIRLAAAKGKCKLLHISEDREQLQFSHHSYVLKSSDIIRRNCRKTSRFWVRVSSELTFRRLSSSPLFHPSSKAYNDGIKLNNFPIQNNKPS